MRKLILAAVLLAAGSTSAFAQYGPGGGPGYGPPPQDYDRRGPPDFDRRPPPPRYRPELEDDRRPRDFDRGQRRCFFVDSEYGPRRVCRRGPPQYH